jgi:hypothetical protein
MTSPIFRKGRCKWCGQNYLVGCPRQPFLARATDRHRRETDTRSGRLAGPFLTDPIGPISFWTMTKRDVA